VPAVEMPDFCGAKAALRCALSEPRRARPRATIKDVPASTQISRTMGAFTSYPWKASILISVTFNVLPLGVS